MLRPPAQPQPTQCALCAPICPRMPPTLASDPTSPTASGSVTWATISAMANVLSALLAPGVRPMCRIPALRMPIQLFLPPPRTNVCANQATPAMGLCLGPALAQFVGPGSTVQEATPIYQSPALETSPLPSVPPPTHPANVSLASSALARPASSVASGRSASAVSSAPALRIPWHLEAHHLHPTVCVIQGSMEPTDSPAPNALKNPSALVETSFLSAPPTQSPLSRAPMQLHATVIGVTRAWPTQHALLVQPTPGAGLEC